MFVDAHRCKDRHVVLLARLNGPLHLRDVLIILGDHEIDTAGLERADLLVELLLHLFFGGATQERWGLADASCDEAAILISHLLCKSAAFCIDLCHSPLGSSLVATI